MNPRVFFVLLKAVLMLCDAIIVPLVAADSGDFPSP